MKINIFVLSTNKLHEAESMRNWWSLNYSRNSPDFNRTQIFIIVCTNPPPSHVNAIHILTWYFCNIYFNITLPFLEGTSAFTTVILYTFLISPMLLQVPHTPPWFHHANIISRRLQIMKLPIMQYPPASHYLYSPIHSKQH